MIPQEIKDYETYIVAYSGGKDSTATLLYALDNLPREKLRFVFCDTGAEWPETYEYIEYVGRELDLTVERAKAGDRELPPKRNDKPRKPWELATSLYELIRLREKWPAPKHYRHCNTFLKQWPLALFARECANPIVLSGQRADESKARMGLPYLSEKGSRSIRQGPPIFRPILKWSECDVWNFLSSHHILPNPIYNYTSRCSCWCCIMARSQEVLNFCRLHPGIAQEVADLEEEIGHTWRDGQSIGNLLRQAQAQLPLFEPQPRFEHIRRYLATKPSL